MRSCLVCFWLMIAATMFAQDKPLASLPYTPSLETKFMDRSADPCADFYKYACGNWNKLNPIPADQASWDVYGKMAEENERFLWGLLDRMQSEAAQRSPNEQKIGDYFHACMDEAAIEKAGLAPLHAELDRIAKLSSPRELAQYVGAEDATGGHDVFNFGSSPDYDDSSRMMAFLFAGGLGLPDRDYYTKTDAKSREIRDRYVAHVEQMLALSGESAAAAAADARTIMEIETALAGASLTRTEMRNPYNLKHKMALADLVKIAPAFDWNEYFHAVDPPSFSLINIAEPKFVTALSDQLRSRDLVAWKAYLRWHLIHREARFLSRPFVTADFAFYRQYLQGAKEIAPRWKRCTRLVDQQLGDALGQVFVAKTFAPQTRADADVVIRQIEAEMERDLKDLSWMSEPTKTQALAKLHAVVNKIGYPDKWKDYSSVSITPGAFLANTTQASAFEQRRDLAKIGKPVDRKEWFMTPPTVNAYYDPQTNDINFPAGVLQPPLFDPKMDAAPNYGNTGATMGHELTHGFDDEGRQFDAQGNLRDWWTPDDAKAFQQRADCVRNQYANYVIVDDIHINSSLTLGEDVADLGGTYLAYLAWKRATADANLQPVEGLRPDQRFFVGMAQWACGDERPELKRMRAITNPHSPLEYRVNGVVVNLPQFGEAFGCRVGQPMMPANACRVW